MGAIVVSGVLGLIDLDEVRFLWRVNKFDFSIWLIAASGTMLLGVKIGLAISVVCSLLLVVYEAAYPHTAMLGRLPGTTVYRSVKQYPLAETFDGIVMIRVDAPIFFANAEHVRDKLEKYERMGEERLEGTGNCVKYIILEMSPISNVDSSALHLLYDVVVTLRERGIQMCFSNPSVRVMGRFEKSGLSEIIGRDHFFVTLHEAVSWCLHEMDCENLSIPRTDSRLISFGECRDAENSLRAWRLWHGAKRRGWGSTSHLQSM